MRSGLQYLAAGAALATLLASAAPAQDLPLPGDGFAWERLGTVGLSANDLAFAADTALWSVGGAGLLRFDFSGGSAPGEWLLVNDRGTSGFHRILPLGRGPTGDTLLVTSFGSMHRSLDGGITWAMVHDEGYHGLYEVSPGYSHAGRLLTGDYGGVPDSRAVAFSDDRGATWTLSAIPERGGAEAFVAYPPGSAYAGRVLATGSWGAMLSDDGGASLRESDLWQFGRFEGHGLCLVERPAADGVAGGLRALAFGFDATEPVLRFWASDDGGETWADVGALVEGPPHGVGGSGVGLVALGGPSALAVGGRGTVYRSDDAGATWAAVGRAPEIAATVFAKTAELGPDGRLYVGLGQTGPSDPPVYRTEPLRGGSVPVEPDAPDAPEGVSVGVEVRPNPASGGAEVVVALASAATVEAVVYDGLGRRVALLTSERYGAGRHTLRFDGSALPAGVYVVHITAYAAGGTATATKRLTIIH